MRLLLTFSLFVTLATVPPRMARAATARSTATCPQLFQPIDSTPIGKINSRSQQVRGYAILIAIMGSSALATTHLSSMLPKDLAFLSQFVAQLSALGIFVIGAPIWEPINSKIRRLAFGVGKNQPPAVHSDNKLETQWHRTQSGYSLNAQMSRNVMQAYLLAAQMSLHQARQAARSGDTHLASDLLAECAIRLRRLFAEIEPDDPSVALAVRASFTRHIDQPETLRPAIISLIETNDPTATDSVGQKYYSRLLNTWLTR